MLGFQGTQDTYTIEKRYVRANGTHIFVQVISSAVRDPGGRFLYGVRVVQDITERRLAQDRAAESERRVRDLLDALPVAIYTTDDQGRITFFNQAAVDFSGRQPTLGEDSWCVSWRLYDSEGVAMRHEECPMATTLRTGEEIRGVIAQAERPDGTRVPFMPFPKVLRDATGEVVGAINMLVDMTARKKAEDEQRILIDELNHRVKNTLATVQSIAAQTYRSTPDSFYKNFETRLLALSRSHDVLARRKWSGIGISELLDQQLAPYAGDEDRVFMDGPALMLDARTGLVLSMIVHELVTNAARHGALSIPRGRIVLKWEVPAQAANTSLRIRWAEVEGPPVQEPRRRGFGTRLIERSIVGDLGGSADLQFARTGLRCDLTFPLT